MLQISNVFTNVSKGEVAKSTDLQKAFGTTDIKAIVAEVWLHDPILLVLYSPAFCHQILKKGEVQVGEKERDHELDKMRKDIVNQVAEKCVDPETQRPYPASMIEKAMTEAGFSVLLNKSSKSQVYHILYSKTNIH